MEDGSTKPIRDVKLGDLVMVTDRVTGKTASRPVSDVIRHSGPHTMVLVRLSDAPTIDATAQHPFWFASLGRWVYASDLVAGDVAVTADAADEIRTDGGHPEATARGAGHVVS